VSLATVYGDGGFLDAKWEVMRRHRTSAQSFEDCWPRCAAWATELYRAPMRDQSLPLEARLRLAPTYVHLAQQVIDAHGPLLVDKEMGAFFATP
jgi:hypothetical protein